jgi:hypothetical protein
VAASRIEPGIDDVCQLAPWSLLKRPTNGRFGRRGGPVRRPTIKEGRAGAERSARPTVGVTAVAWAVPPAFHAGSRSWEQGSRSVFA